MEDVLQTSSGGSTPPSSPHSRYQTSGGDGNHNAPEGNRQNEDTGISGEPSGGTRCCLCCVRRPGGDVSPSTERDPLTLQQSGRNGETSRVLSSGKRPKTYGRASADVFSSSSDDENDDEVFRAIGREIAAIAATNPGRAAATARLNIQSRGETSYQMIV